MLRNFFKAALRNLRHYHSHALLNLAGLTVGIAACLLIFLVVEYEQSFDGFHKNKSQIYRVVRVGKNPVGREYRTGVPFPVTEGLRRDYPQLEKVAAILGDNGVQVLITGSRGETLKKFKENNVFLAEPQFFQMFDFGMLAGDPSRAIVEPNTVMLAQATASKYFGDWKAAMGKTIKVYRSDMKITGILKNPPPNTDFPLQLVISYATVLKQVNLNNWINIDDNNYCFAQLKPEASQAQLDALLPAFVTRHMPPDHAGYDLKLEPLREMHFDDRFGNFNGRTFSEDLITALSLIGLFLLVVACVNFINLSTAQAINRAKEVGVRKVLGSSRNQLLLQFQGETGLTSLFALVLATILAMTTLPFLNGLLETQLSFNFFHNPELILFLLGVLITVSLLSGIYPALVLSGFNPILALKSKIISQSGKGTFLRRSLVVLQFVIAQALIIGTLVVVTQMDFFKNADLGFNKTAIVSVPYPGDSLSRTRNDMMRQELQKEPGIREVSFSAGIPTGDADWFTDLQLPDNHTEKPDLVVGMKIADTAYFGIYRFALVAGRIYDPSDTVREFMVNETLLKSLNFGSAEGAIGKQIKVLGRTLPIVGVLKDFHVNSMRDPIRPLVMTTMKDGYGTANIQLEPGKANASIAGIESLWNKLYPDWIFEYHFVDQTVADYYKQENQLSQLYKIFSGIAICISCLGLYGLISFMAVRRNKEIGIRKVLGSTAREIVFLLSREFTLLILLSFVIASPIAWYFMKQWLEDYYYRIDLTVTFFLLTIVASLIIAWLTIGYTAIKAAMANPVNALRTE